MPQPGSPPPLPTRVEVEPPRPADACFPMPVPGAPAAPETPLVELHVEHAGGRVEVLSLPWRLAPSGTLSQRYGGPVVPASAHAPVPAQAFAAAKAWNGTVPVPQEPAEAAIAANGPAGGRPPSAQASMHPAIQVAEAADDDPLSRASRAVPQAQPWLERLYRWAERAGVDPSLWIRDYRLGPEQARDLASALQALAHERGVALHRIVVNGREAWHAAASAHVRDSHRHQED